MANPLAAAGHALAGITKAAVGFSEYMAAQKNGFHPDRKARGDQAVQEAMAHFEKAVRNLR